MTSYQRWVTPDARAHLEASVEEWFQSGDGKGVTRNAFVDRITTELLEKVAVDEQSHLAGV